MLSEEENLSKKKIRSEEVSKKYFESLGFKIRDRDFEGKKKGTIFVATGLSFLAFGEFLGWYSFVFPESILYYVSISFKITGLISMFIPISKIPLTKIKFDPEP